MSEEIRSEELSNQIDLYIAKHYEPQWGTKRGFLAKRDGKNLSAGIAGAVAALDVREALKRLPNFLKKLEPTFSEYLMELIEQKGRKPAEIYKKADITRDHFAKIKNNPSYHPQKETVLALAVALHLNLEETQELLGRAGYSLSHSNKGDLIVEFFIVSEIYNVNMINIELAERGLKPLTNWRQCG